MKKWYGQRCRGLLRHTVAPLKPLQPTNWELANDTTDDETVDDFDFPRATHCSCLLAVLIFAFEAILQKDLVQRPCTKVFTREFS